VEELARAVAEQLVHPDLHLRRQKEMEGKWKGRWGKGGGTCDDKKG